MKLSQFINPNYNVARSINLERDHEQTGLIDSYQITSKSLEVLYRFLSALNGEQINAWSLTGPYGMGKSAFVNYLLAITGSSGKSSRKAFKKLKGADSKLHRKLKFIINKKVGAKGFFQIPVTSAYEPINQSLWRGLKKAVDNDDSFEMPVTGTIDSQELIDLFNNVKNRVKKPIIIVIDEFGKNLDYMSHNHDKGDLYIMQQLSEMESVYIWVCLHQAFDEYASGLTSNQKREWSKIQGRFEDISFVETNEQMLKMIERIIEHNFHHEFDEIFNNYRDKVYKIIRDVDFDSKLFNKETILSIFPMHPLSAMSLIELCKKFAQNDRTLLSFLCSGDNYALTAFLENNTMDSKSLPVIGLDYLYDYFFNISINAYINRAESQRWIEIHDIINRKGYLSDLEKTTLKTVGVLNLLSGASGLKANYKIIKSALNLQGFSEVEIKNVLNNLVEKKTIIYREYADEYRLWEGSDFDINEAVQKKKASLALNELDDFLQLYIPLPPMIASRHSYETGTVRRFERRWMSASSLSSEVNPKDDFDGLFVYCYGVDQSLSDLPQQCKDNKPLLIAYTSSQKAFLELALDVISLKAVLETSTQLEHDSVAKKEIKYRIKVAEERFIEYCSRVYSPHSNEIIWYKKASEINIRNMKALSAELSKLCDEYYYECPFIGNEMINYNKISGAAARARRELIEAITTSSAEEHLGLQGYGPEVALYRSLLLANNLHVKNNEIGHWFFTVSNNPDLNHIWNHIEGIVNDNSEDGVTIEKITKYLKKPPIGMRQGPAPIFITVFLMANYDDIAVFQEGVYKPYLKASDLALMLKRPELFVIKKVVKTNVDKEVFDIYKTILNTVQSNSFDSYRNASLLAVVGPLMKFIDTLTPYSKQTKQISYNAQQVRLTIQNATDPMQLLFEEIPAALSVDFLNTDSIILKEKLQTALQEISDAYGELLGKIRDMMLKTFKSDTIEELYQKQQVRVTSLLNHCEDPDLKAVLQAFAREYDDPYEWVKGIAGIVTKKPVDSWTDDEFIPFTVKIKDYASRIDQLEALVSSGGNFISKDKRLITIMMPNGQFKREVINVNHGLQEVIEGKVDSLLALPQDQAKAIFMALAEELFRGDD